MPRPTSKNIDAWAQLLAESLRSREMRPPGDGWKTFAEVQEYFGTSRKKTYQLLAAGKNCGTVEMFEGRILRDGKLIRHTWYLAKLRDGPAAR